MTNPITERLMAHACMGCAAVIAFILEPDAPAWLGRLLVRAGDHGFRGHKPANMHEFNR
jgi:hypothetical protein